MASTGGILVIIAASVFLSWIWPTLGAAARVLTLGAMGAGIKRWGWVLAGGYRARPVGQLLQIAGLGVFAVALVIAGDAWTDGSPPAIAVGLLAMAIPVHGLWVAVGKSVVMPAFELGALGFVVSLGFSAALLSWLAARLGRGLAEDGP